MAHVVSQMDQRDMYSQNYGRATLKPQALSGNLKPPAIAPRRHNTNGQTPSLSLLVTSNHNHWKPEVARKDYRHFSPDKVTPVSAVDSVFELSSANAIDSPGSSLSSFVAELEDTSPNATKPQALPVNTKAPISPTVSLHAATAIDAIHDIEAENKNLLERAIAAENVAKRLEKQNIDLIKRVNYCMERHRPKTAPTQRSSQNQNQYPRNRNLSSNAGTTPLSAFNAMMDAREPEYIPTPISATPTPLPRRKSSLPQESPVSPQQSEYTPNRFGPTGFVPSRRAPPIPESMGSQQQNHARNADAQRNNLPRGSGLRSHIRNHTHTTQMATTTSLADAQRRAKPLPPLGPMSPSAVPGVVEMGERHLDVDVLPVQRLRPKKSFAQFFRKGRKD